MASEGAGYREDVDQARRRFAEYRQAHAVRSRLPEELWATAAKLARRDGITATARVLGVDGRVFQSGRIDCSLALPQSRRSLRAGIRWARVPRRPSWNCWRRARQRQPV